MNNSQLLEKFSQNKYWFEKVLLIKNEIQAIGALEIRFQIVFG
jgi:hypothetical protein